MDRYEVKGFGGTIITGWSPTPDLAGERAALYLRTGSNIVIITDKEAK